MAWFLAPLGAAYVWNEITDAWTEHVTKPIDQWQKEREEEAQKQWEEEHALKAKERREEMKVRHDAIRKEFGIAPRVRKEEEKVDVGCKSFW